MPDTKPDRAPRQLGDLTDQLYGPAIVGDGAADPAPSQLPVPARQVSPNDRSGRQDASLSALSQAAANMVPQNLQELDSFAKLISKSAMVPEAYRGKPGDVVVAIMHGLELGLKPLQALQNLAVINGKPSIYGDAAIAVVRASPLCEYVRETFDEQAMVATCRVKRAGEEEQARTFSKADAVRAGLWDERPKIRKKGRDGGGYEAANTSPWYCYPKRMLQMRARSWALRDVFADVMSGLWLREEAMDIPAEPVEAQQARQARPVPTRSAPRPPAEEAEWAEAEVVDDSAEAPAEPISEKALAAIEKAALKLLGAPPESYEEDLAAAEAYFSGWPEAPQAAALARLREVEAEREQMFADIERMKQEAVAAVGTDLQDEVDETAARWAGVVEPWPKWFRRTAEAAWETACARAIEGRKGKKKLKPNDRSAPKEAPAGESTGEPPGEDSSGSTSADDQASVDADDDGFGSADEVFP